jgi:TonB family protein
MVFTSLNRSQAPVEAEEKYPALHIIRPPLRGHMRTLTTAILPCGYLLALLASPVSAQVPQGPAWQIDTSHSEMTDQPSVTLTLEDLESVRYVPRRLLIVQCVENHLDVHVSTGLPLQALDESTPVRLRWDSGPAERAYWSISTDYRSAFAPDSRPFLRQLLANPDLRIEVQSDEAGAQTIKFNARGLEQYMPTLNAACPEPPPDVSAGSLSVTWDATYEDSVVEEKPTVLSASEPEYPSLLRAAGVTGRVLVEAVIDPRGRAEPASIKVVQSPNPGFDAPAKRYVQRALFRPARIHGLPVRARTTVAVDFAITR